MGEVSSEQVTGNGTSQTAAANGAQDRKRQAKAERRQLAAAKRQKRQARAMVKRIRTAADGSINIVRFSTLQCLEHQLLMVTFTSLTLTGLLQRYSTWLPAAWVINVLFGGIDVLRVLHRVAAILFILQSVYHAWAVFYVWFVKQELGAMWPRRQDWRDLKQMIRYNLDRTEEKPAHDRYSVEEKIEYWALIWGSIVMILTGLVQWFPAETTILLPGAAVPISRVVHSWEAVLAALSILIWHMYHAVIKHRNSSIFTGLMNEEEMIEFHPKEYQRILEAQQTLQKHQTKNGAGIMES